MVTQPPPIPPRALDYGGPDPQSPGRSADDWIWAFLPPFLSFGAVIGVFTLAMVFVIPRFEQIFKDFRLDLPGPTKLLLAVSRWFTNDYGWAFSVAACTALAVGLAFLDERARRRRRWLYPLLALLLFIGAVVFVILALFLPMISLMDGISGTSKK